MTASCIARTERLLLRRLAPDDRDALSAVLCDPEVMRFSMGVLRPEDVADWIDQRIAEYGRWGFGLWGVELLESGCLIGYCGLTVIEIDGHSEVEIGYRLVRTHWGRGLGTEAARVVRDLALQSLAIRRLIALIDPDNHASIRVASKLGMRDMRPVEMPDYDHPDRLYVLTFNHDDLL